MIIAFFTSRVGTSAAFLLVPFQLSVLGFASYATTAFGTGLTEHPAEWYDRRPTMCGNGTYHSR